MRWILIWYAVFSNTGGATSSVVFNSKEACEQTAVELIASKPTEWIIIRAKCFPDTLICQGIECRKQVMP